MNDIEIKKIWQSYDQKLDQILLLNKELTTEMTKSKAKSLISKIRPYKYVGLLFGIPWLILVNFLCFIGIKSGGIFFPISFGVISIIYYIAIGIYIYHLFLVNQINRSDSVIEVQEKMAEIKSSDILATRIAILQIPLWSIFWLDVYSELIYLIIPGIIFLAFCLITIYLFVNIKASNMHKKWMKFLFSGSEWNALIRANDLLEEIKEYKI
jgi:hypothetical protein